MLRFAHRFLGNEKGATAIEYGLIVALVSVGAVIALDSMGDSLVSIFDLVTTELTQIATRVSSAS